MLFSALATLLPALVSASPVEKRYTGVTIQSGRTGSCLTLQGGVQVIDGSLLTLGACSTATLWDINPGSGSVKVSGLNFALDAGVNPHNNVPAKVWTSYPGLTQQTWYLTNDNRIAITGGNQCLDAGDNGPQTYQCVTGNTNQVWYVGGNGPPPPSSSSSSMAPAQTGQAIRWNQGPTNRCVTAQAAGALFNGAPVNIQDCAANGDAFSVRQRWVVNQNGVIQLANTNFCLDAGVNPSNGVQMKIWTCYPGLSQQTWNYQATVNSGGIFQTANNQCLDLNNSNYINLQTWACSTPDPQQQFSLLNST